MKTLLANRNIIASIFVVMLSVYGVQGVSYGQQLNYDLEGSPPTVTPGEINTTLKVSFPDIFYAYDVNAYQIQLRRKTPQEEWITACAVVSHGGNRGGGLSDLPIIGIFFLPSSSAGAGNVNFIFTNLEPGTTYEARYRDTNLSECPEDHENPPDADPWSAIVEGTTHLVAPPRVELADANLARSVRRALNLDTGGEHIELLKIPEAALAKLTELNATRDNKSEKIVNLTGLEHASQLTKLLLEKNGISDITLLEQLTNLAELSLSSNQIRDITPLSGLTNLTWLSLSSNQIRDITPLSGLTNLTELYLYENQIRDTTPLTTLVWLKTLDLKNNQIRDVTPLANLTYLEKLELSGNFITDTSPLNALADENPGMKIDVLITLTASTPHPLTAATLAGSVITLTLPNAWAFENLGSSYSWSQNLRVSGIDITGGYIDFSSRSTVNANKRTITLNVGKYRGAEGIIIKDSKIIFTLKPGAIVDYDGPALTAELPVIVSTTDANITVTETTTTDAAVSISPASAASPAVGDQLEVSLNIIGGEAVAGYQASVQFDRTALRFVSGVNGDFLPAGAFFVEPKVTGNLVQLNAASLAGNSNGDGTLATLIFEVIAVKVSTLTLSDVLLTNSAGKTSVPNIENAEITGPAGLKGDVNGDGTVNIADLVLVASNLGNTGQHAADVNGDGQVNIADLVLVAGALGNSAAAPSLHLQSLDMLTTADVKIWLSQAQHLTLMDTKSQRGIRFLEQLLAALTPQVTALLANYPNPFNPETWLPYHLAEAADVQISIYNTAGALIRRLDMGHQSAGFYTEKGQAVYWDGRNEQGGAVASGVYFYQLRAGNYSQMRRMLVVK